MLDDIANTNIKVRRFLLANTNQGQIMKQTMILASLKTNTILHRDI